MNDYQSRLSFLMSAVKKAMDEAQQTLTEPLAAAEPPSEAEPDGVPAETPEERAWAVHDELQSGLLWAIVKTTDNHELPSYLLRLIQAHRPDLRIAPAAVRMPVVGTIGDGDVVTWAPGVKPA